MKLYHLKINTPKQHQVFTMNKPTYLLPRCWSSHFALWGFPRFQTDHPSAAGRTWEVVERPLAAEPCRLGARVCWEPISADPRTCCASAGWEGCCGDGAQGATGCWAPSCRVFVTSYCCWVAACCCGPWQAATRFSLPVLVKVFGNE